jgi:hypothetical protein
VKPDSSFYMQNMPACSQAGFFFIKWQSRFIEFFTFHLQASLAVGEKCKECLLRKRPARPAKPGDTIINEGLRIRKLNRRATSLLLVSLVSLDSSASLHPPLAALGLLTLVSPQEGKYFH